MKNVKQYAIAAIVVMASLQLSAQTFGIRAGYTQFTPDFTGEKIDQFSDPVSRPGFQFGPIIDLKISDMASIETGLLFTHKGYDYKQFDQRRFDDQPYYRDGDVTLNGIKLPVTFKLSVRVSKSVKIVGVAGNYIAMGISGTTKGTETNLTETYNYNEPYWESGAVGLFQKFDTGFLFGAGVELGQVEIRASYEMGLIDIARHAYHNLEVYNQSFNVSVGYRFKNK